VTISPAEDRERDLVRELFPDYLIAQARRTGNARMHLDTLPTGTGARRLDGSLGFVGCPADYACPVGGNVCMTLDLAAGTEKGSSADPSFP
jgi:hypothetical protein